MADDKPEETTQEVCGKSYTHYPGGRQVTGTCGKPKGHSGSCGPEHSWP
jgi:hypothetical protein